MKESIIKIKNLSKYVNQKSNTQPILKDISFDVFKGEFVSIMGPSGCGKSTLLYSITSLDDFDKGEVIISGESISKLTSDEKTDFRNNKIGFVFQKTTFLEKLSILENIVLPANLSNRSKEEITKRAVDLMEQMDISKLKDHTIYQASGGELQRAGICRALINEPKIIFADEPTGALNSKNADNVINILQKINKDGTTIVLVTHDPKVAMNGNRLLFMLDGEIYKEINLNNINENLRLVEIYKEMEKIGI